MGWVFQGRVPKKWVLTWLPTALHQTQLLDGPAANAVLHVIWEIALQDPHRIPLVIGDRMGHQLAGLAAVNWLKVRLRKRGVRVPAVDLRVALVPEENRRAIVRANDDHATGLLAEIYKINMKFKYKLVASHMCKKK